MQSYFENYIEYTKNIIYIDMGGGSTEIAHFENKILKDCVSLDIGLLYLLARLFNKNGTTDSALQELNAHFESHFDLHQTYFDKLNTMINQTDCSLILTGMIGKKIAEKYKTDKFTITSFGSYLNESQNKALIEDSIQDLKNQYLASYSLRRKINNYISGGYLFFLLQRFDTATFYVNNFGLSNSFETIYNDYIKKTLS